MAKPFFERSAGVTALAAAARYGLGQIAAAEDDFARAVEHFEAALAAQPEAGSVHHPLGIAYRQLGAMDKAREHLRRVGRGEVQFVDPVVFAGASAATGAGYHHTLGTEALQAGDRGRAVAEFRKALEMDPDLVGTRLSLARALAATGDAEAAAAQYEDALRREPESALAHYEYGRFLVGLAGRRPGALAEAERHFRAALGSAPDYRPAFLGLAMVLRRGGRLNEAAEVLGDLVELDPGDRQARFQRALVLAETGDRRLAVAELELLLVEPGRGGPPEGATVFEALANVLAREGDAAFALERLRGVRERLDEGELRARVEQLIAGLDG